VLSSFRIRVKGSGQEPPLSVRGTEVRLLATSFQLKPLGRLWAAQVIFGELVVQGRRKQRLGRGCGRRFAPLFAPTAAHPALLPTNWPAASLRSLQASSPIERRGKDSIASDSGGAFHREVVGGVWPTSRKVREKWGTLFRGAAGAERQNQSQRQRARAPALHGQTLAGQPSWLCLHKPLWEHVAYAADLGAYGF
jgi:hypothetical protein